MKALGMYYIFLLILIGISFNCSESSKEIQSDIDRLIKERDALTFTVQSLGQQKITEQIYVNQLREEKGILKSGRTPVYILKLKLKQSHVSLSIKKHLKDAMNAITFTMPVNKAFYEKVRVGDNLVDKFRAGSFVLSGSFGSWKMTVLEKKIGGI